MHNSNTTPVPHPTQDPPLPLPLLLLLPNDSPSTFHTAQMSTLAYLRALHATIGHALDDIDRVDREQNLDFPAPDAPMIPNSEAEKLRNDPAVIKAADYIVSACGQLSNAVHDPFHTLMEALCACHLTASLQVLEAGHIAEILRDAGPDGLHIGEIARQVDRIRAGSNGSLSKPLDPSWLGQIMRLLATHEWTREIRPDVFVNNRLSSFIDSGLTLEQLRETPGNKYDTNAAIAMVPMSTSEPFRTMTSLSDFLLSPTCDTKWNTPFNYAFQTEDGMYAWFERPENAPRLKQIGRALTAADQAEGRGDVTSTTTFPWDSLPSDTLVVDVGGGIGALSVRLALAHSHLKFIV
ncbi:hypothetical protein C8Q80DRAFT_154588 [Daedaleopsis nitida]|nr:hypothetical protein C8Q80DRAFT_154588 [Daedaleopsis nitida]